MATTPRGTGTPPSSGAASPPANPRHARRAYRAGYTRGASGDTTRPAWLDANDVPQHYQDAYAAGQSDAAAAGAPPSSAGTETQNGPRGDSGRSSFAKRYRAPSIDGPTEALAKRSPLPIAGDAGGFLLGLIGYALGFNFLQGGMPQVRGWVGAKLLNKPYNANANPSGAPAAPAGPFGAGTPTGRVTAIPNPFAPRDNSVGGA